ncbi:LPXTG cell wall anchor domain-containing protein [Saccharothrix variisporea]|uniref:LPXTG-motif cell wall-anchored protein n=1 Tax=Saccharothrix variisporea TaxID=543527 RepID=A0A495XS55_9PSEU|nr:SdrD B-like domain-containing protein [Saccharothrix variisporea]RKT74508.1 LPXTG-motif cell wall-anchored protein [Saccharothrix variisporea]
MSRLLRSAAAASAVGLCLAVSAGPALADDPPADVPDLRLSVWFDRAGYFGWEDITVHARVTNAGTAAVQQVAVTSTGNLTDHTWRPSGIPLDPGQSVEVAAQGRITTTEDHLHLVVTVGGLDGEPDANPADNTVLASVPVSFPRGSYRGTVYGDRDGDDALDPGEALAGVPVEVTGGYPEEVVRAATTDATGRFAFTDLPGGGYSIRFGTPEWHFEQPAVVVDGVDDPDVLVRGLPVVDWSALAVTSEFTAPSYRVDDVARMRVTLTNNGPAQMAGVTATCSASADGEVERGELGTGVLLPARTTKSVELSARITRDSAAQGHLRVRCSLGAPPYGNGDVTTTATARVPGGVAPKVVGRVTKVGFQPQSGPPSGEPLVGAKVWLRDQVTGRVFARAVTEADGRFTFLDVPAGLHDFGVVGPWRFVYSGPELVARDGENGPVPYQHLYFVVPGPDQPDPDPPSGGDPAPPREHPEEPPLAATGAGTTWLTFTGLLALTAGTALLHLSRRRTRH